MKRSYGLFTVFVGVLLLIAVDITPSYSQVPTLPTAQPSTLINPSNYIRSSRLGITFISSAEKVVTEERYRNALLLGAGWNRWPLYWYRVQPSPDSFNWDEYDQVLLDDLRHGLRVNAILMGIPTFYQDNDLPRGIHEPIFSDGTDDPGAGKSLNPDNPWVTFVFRTVNRYRPGGEFAVEYGLGQRGIRVWEIWNEPDFVNFWTGTPADYARLLKISYIVAKQADPNATIMVGGLLYPEQPNWFNQVMGILSEDSSRNRFNWFMDAVAVHSYSNPFRSGHLVKLTRETMARYGVIRPIWLNESGVPAWDDYPGPIWTVNEPDQRVRRATIEQQAWYFIQSTAFAWAEGAEVVFYHQLYDDCGDQAAGTDFPPHQGELCSDGRQCWGDAFGIYRNPSGAICFSQHPFPGSPRPVADAYRLMATIMGSEHFEVGDVQSLQDVRAITFLRPHRNERIVFLWNRTLLPTTADVPALGGQARLYTLSGAVDILSDQDDLYRVQLVPAIRDNYPNPEDGSATAIGGEPVILVETVPDGIELVGSVGEADESEPLETPRPVPTVQPTPGPIIPTPLPATAVITEDTTPPQATVLPLPAFSDPIFVVEWIGTDNGAIERYLIWVRIDGGEWMPWLDTTRTSAEYIGSGGSTYEFAAWALDTAGNWSTNTDLQPQAVTTVQ